MAAVPRLDRKNKRRLKPSDGIFYPPPNLKTTTKPYTACPTSPPPQNNLTLLEACRKRQKPPRSAITGRFPTSRRDRNDRPPNRQPHQTRHHRRHRPRVQPRPRTTRRHYHRLAALYRPLCRRRVSMAHPKCRRSLHHLIPCRRTRERRSFMLPSLRPIPRPVRRPRRNRRPISSATTTTAARWN